MARKKILWLCSWYPTKADPFNGDFIQRHARAAALYNDIYVLHLAARSSGEDNANEAACQSSEGLTEQIITYKKIKSFWGRLISHYRWMYLYRQALRNFIVKYGKPDLVHVQVPMKDGIMALWFSKKYKIPYLVTEHWGIYNDVAEDNFKTRSKLFRYYTGQVLEKAAKFITVSRYLGEAVNRLVVQKEYEVVPNVADTRFFFYTPRQGLLFRFIHVSNMVPLKNTEGIIRAFAAAYPRLNNAELVLVGDRDTLLHTIAASMHLPEGAIRFRGEVAYEQVAVEMQQANCLVLFSNIENSPCVIGEALCCGLPVIATNVGGIPELVDEDNSMLVTPGDEAGLTAAMLQMIEEQERFNAAEIAEKASGRFSYETAGNRFNRLYSEVLDTVT